MPATTAPNNQTSHKSRSRITFESSNFPPSPSIDAHTVRALLHFVHLPSNQKLFHLNVKVPKRLNQPSRKTVGQLASVVCGPETRVETSKKATALAPSNPLVSDVSLLESVVSSTHVFCCVRFLTVCRERPLSSS